MTEAPKPQPKRTDPASRPVHASTLGGHIYHPDPNKHYVWAQREGEMDNANNHDYYESIGYSLERWDSKNPLKINTGSSSKRKDGDPITFRDMVLMSCPKERKTEIDQFGPDGGSGRQLFQIYMDKIQKNQIEKPADKVNGIHQVHDISVEDSVFR